MSPMPVQPNSSADPDLNAHRDRLLARRAELFKRLPKIEGHLRTQATPDALIEDVGSLHQNDAVLEHLSAADRHQLSAIVSALARVEAGGYGNCTGCGEAIEPARLLHLPWAPLCVACAKRAEHHG